MDNRARKTTLGLCYTAFFISGMGSLMLGSLIPVLRDYYHLDYAYIGLLLSAQPVGTVLSAMASAVLPLKIGRKRTVLLLSSWMVVAYFLFAAADARILLLLACFLTGISRGGTGNFVNLVVGTVAEDNAGAMNLLHASFSFGAVLSPYLVLLGPSLVGAEGFRLTAGIMMAIAVLQIFCYLGVCRRPVPEPAKGGRASLDFLRSRNYRWSCIQLFGYVAAEFAVTGWLVTYLCDTGVMTGRAAQMTGSILWIVMLAGRLSCAAASRWLTREKMLLLGGTGTLLCSLLLLSAKTSWVATVGTVGVGFCMAGIYPNTFAGVREEIAGNDLASGVFMTLSSAGGMVTPVVFGRLAETFGIRAGMTMVVILSAALVALIFRTNHIRKTAKTPQD